MKRSSKPREVGFAAWLIGLVLVGGALVGVFSLGRSSWLAHLPGVDTSGREWGLYNALFDRHPAAAGDAMPIIRFGTSKASNSCVQDQPGGTWHSRWFEGEGYGDSVEVRNLSGREGLLVRFKPSAPYHEQRRIQLTPLASDHPHAAQLGLLAAELGLVTPASAVVRVLSCGADLGLHRQQEWVDQDFLERRGIRGASLVSMGMDPSRPDQQFAVIEADSAERIKVRGIMERTLAEVAQGNTDMLAAQVDEKAAMAWLLMAWIDGRDLREGPVVLAYHWSTGRFSPIYQVPSTFQVEEEHAPLLNNLLTPLLRRPDFRSRFAQQQAELASKWPALRSKLDAATSASGLSAAPLVAERLSATHIANSNAATYLNRPTHNGLGHATFLHGMSVPAVALASVADTAALARLTNRYKLTVRGDTIIFPRGKYPINEDLEFPAGKVVVMLQGARLFIAAGRSILCKGDLHIRGTLRNPVFVRAQDDAAPFGALALVGSGSQQCSIGGLYISGGSGAKLAGVQCSGMLTVQGAARTLVVASVLQANTAAASLAVDGGEVQLRDVRFEDDARQFARLTHVRGVLRDITMVGARTNSTNGLYIGTGTVALSGGVFTKLNGTAIHADEAAQVLVRRVRLSQNATAIRSEGRAEVHVEGNTIDGNAMVFATSGTAPGHRILVYPNMLTGNTAERVPNASIRESAQLDETVVSVFGVPLKEPVNETSGTGRRRAGRR